jgi:DNA processing protein
MECSEWAKGWLLIESVRGVGTMRWSALLQTKLKTMPEIVADVRTERGREELTRLIGRPVGPPDERFVDDQIARLEKRGCGLVTLSDANYPERLREIPVPPPFLFFEGSLEPLAKLCICVVGSRGASRLGALTAKTLGHDLSARGVHVVSGLARGIDSAAHVGALEGAGGTTAVLGCGLDRVYPRENASLARRIAEIGCVLSEFFLGEPPLRHNFPRRNRILSGLSYGAVIVEAGPKSGAMNTASWAVSHNRMVFAVPGPIDHAGSRGPHTLIRQGAVLVEGVEDILAEIPSYARIGLEGTGGGGAAGGSAEHFTESERAILAALDLNPKHIDELVQFCDISPTAMLPLLLDLEMRGLVSSCGGGSYALAAPRSSG